MGLKPHEKLYGFALICAGPLFFMTAGYGQHNFYFAQHFENMECYPAAPYGPLAGPARNIDWHYERKYLRA